MTFLGMLMEKVNLTKQQELCLSCMECCRWLTFITEVPKDKVNYMTPLYKMRDCKVTVMPRGGKAVVVILVPKTCHHLSPIGCAIYQTRPQACRDYDGRRDPVLKDICKWNELEEK